MPAVPRQMLCHVCFPKVCSTITLAFRSPDGEQIREPSLTGPNLFVRRRPLWARLYYRVTNFANVSNCDVDSLIDCRYCVVNSEIPFVIPLRIRASSSFSSNSKRGLSERESLRFSSCSSENRVFMTPPMTEASMRSMGGHVRHGHGRGFSLSSSHFQISRSTSNKPSQIQSRTQQGPNLGQR